MLRLRKSRVWTETYVSGLRHFCGKEGRDADFASVNKTQEKTYQQTLSGMWNNSIALSLSDGSRACR